MIGEKLAKIMEEIVPVAKTEAGLDNNYKIPKAEDIIKMVEPLLVKNKVGIIPSSITNFISAAVDEHTKMVEDENKDYIEVEMPGSGYDEKSGRAVFSALTRNI